MNWEEIKRGVWDGLKIISYVVIGSFAADGIKLGCKKVYEWYMEKRKRERLEELREFAKILYEMQEK